MFNSETCNLRSLILCDLEGQVTYRYQFTCLYIIAQIVIWDSLLYICNNLQYETTNASAGI